jgi:murein L,D-transpeptidase YcbB/YkuD
MPADPIAPWPLERRGGKIFPVRPLQQLLRARNHSIDVDGMFGPKTDAAVKTFQRSNSLDDDGIVGPITWRALVSGMLSGYNRRSIELRRSRPRSMRARSKPVQPTIRSAWRSRA